MLLREMTISRVKNRRRHGFVANEMWLTVRFSSAENTPGICTGQAHTSTCTAAGHGERNYRVTRLHGQATVSTSGYSCTGGVGGWV